MLYLKLKGTLREL